MLAFAAKQGEFKDEEPADSATPAKFPEKPLVVFHQQWFDKTRDVALSETAQRGQFVEENQSNAGQFPTQPKVSFNQQWFDQRANAQKPSQ